MDGLITGKLFYYKNLVFFISQIFFLFDIACVFAFADLSLKLGRNKTKQSKDIWEIGLGMSNKHFSFSSLTSLTHLN